MLLRKERTRNRSDKGVPLEWFRFRRIITDEIHEATCPDDENKDENEEGKKDKTELDAEDKMDEEDSDSDGEGKKKKKKKKKPAAKKEDEKSAKKTCIAARELLGVGINDPEKVPLRSHFTHGLTGTPLLNEHTRVVELAKLCGNMHVAGAHFHWRQQERASKRDQFLILQGMQDFESQDAKEQNRE